MKTSQSSSGKMPAVRVELPLRIDLAGGWSDTPPICNEVGGCVLNAAVELEGHCPVVAEVSRIDVKEVHVTSADLGLFGILKTKHEIYGPKSPDDWCALVKSALTVTKYDFKEGGLSIRIFADVPKGSGMGTSSILGAALVEALLSVRGVKPTLDDIARLTLRLEREMGTCGGWEDQVGGLYPGVKLITTNPGEEQIFEVKRLSSKAEYCFSSYLQRRGVLYFTGQKRMARNILKGVVDFYKRDPEGIATAIVTSLKKDAAASFRALVKGDFATYERHLNSYWMQKKALDPGSTNPVVESIIARIAPWTAAVSLAGAGGGGFLFAIAKSASAKAKMQKVLATAGNGGKCYGFKIRSAETLNAACGSI